LSNKNNDHTGLSRTLSLKNALSIGVGTMVGAGIFVFPGIASGEVGTAAMLSFGLAGLIALIVALCTAELATAMPSSGGGYFFVSRTFGSFWGMLTGVSMWIGLIFASSFYLTGFGRYFIEILKEAGMSPGDPSVLLAVGMALLLTLVNFLGTKGVGKLQNTIVLSLTGILMMLFLYGILEITGILGDSRLPKSFSPEGLGPVFGVSALVFTSFLGFVQIATVAGEIKRPQINLPRALIGSVLIVTLLYIVAIFVSNSVLTHDRLGELGETALVEVMRSLVGPWGALITMFAGLLATLSSANASILSSSRAVYALSRDELIPSWISKVHDRFGTPHYALLFVGFPIAGLSVLGRIEILAEVASFLHLIIYGMLCICVIVLKRRKPIWYLPGFKVPGYPLLPAVGMIACFGLIVFMEGLSIILGGSVLLFAVILYLLTARKTKLASPKPPHIEPKLRKPRILIPVSLPQEKSLPLAILKGFTDLEVLLIGYKEVPEQTDPEQFKEEKREDAKEELQEVKKQLEAEDFKVESEIVFTPNISDTLKNIIVKYNCHAMLESKPIRQLKRLLVPLYDQNQISSRLATVIKELITASDLPITLLFLENSKEIQSMKNKAFEQLKQTGIKSDQIKTEEKEVKDITDAVKDITEEDDLVILVEANSKKRESLINKIKNEISEAIECPVLVVLEEKKQEQKKEKEEQDMKKKRKKGENKPESDEKKEKKRNN